MKARQTHKALTATGVKMPVESRCESCYSKRNLENINYKEQLQ